MVANTLFSFTNAPLRYLKGLRRLRPAEGPTGSQVLLLLGVGLWGAGMISNTILIPYVPS